VKKSVGVKTLIPHFIECYVLWQSVELAAKGDQDAINELNAFNLPPEIRQDLALDFGRLQEGVYRKYSSQARKMVKPKFDKLQHFRRTRMPERFI
jgi:hypothetical protein